MRKATALTCIATALSLTVLCASFTAAAGISGTSGIDLDIKFEQIPVPGGTPGLFYNYYAEENTIVIEKCFDKEETTANIYVRARPLHSNVNGTFIQNEDFGHPVYNFGYMTVIYQNSYQFNGTICKVAKVTINVSSSIIQNKTELLFELALFQPLLPPTQILNIFLQYSKNTSQTPVTSECPEPTVHLGIIISTTEFPVPEGKLPHHYINSCVTGSQVEVQVCFNKGDSNLVAIVNATHFFYNSTSTSTQLILNSSPSHPVYSRSYMTVVYQTDFKANDTVCRVVKMAINETSSAIQARAEPVLEIVLFQPPSIYSTRIIRIAISYSKESDSSAKFVVPPLRTIAGYALLSLMYMYLLS